MPPRKLESDYGELATELGWRWLGPYPDTVNDPTWWQCENDHVFQRSYKRARERGCIYCNGHWNKQRADYVALAELHGLRPPDILPATTRDMAEWRLGDSIILSSYHNLVNRVLTHAEGDKIDRRAKEQFVNRAIQRRCQGEGLHVGDG